ncbi:MAG: ABC transporter ATP-binding protein [Gemmatales bacterium]|nr:MAG: ABC transporter ATP-binding protein [Gemmatales bacterium]
MTIAAEFDNVVKDYPCGWLGRQKLRALDGVSFQVETGQVLGLIGPNRAGKTTLAKILLSLCRLTAGKAFRFGEPVDRQKTLCRVGYMHENQAFPRYWNARGILEFYGALSLVNADVICRRIPILLEKVGLADRSDEPISQFSKGMVQRLALAQSIINDPDLLVLDEPTAGLDAEGRRLVHEIVRERRQRGGAVILITHLMSDIEALCDRVVAIRAGKLVREGPIDSFRKESESFEQSIEPLLEAQPT